MNTYQLPLYNQNNYLEKVLLVFMIFDVVVNVIGRPPRGLAALQFAGVHLVVPLVPGVGELGDVLQTNGRLPAVPEPLLQGQTHVDHRPLLLDVLLSGGILGIFQLTHGLSFLFKSLPV